MEVRKSLSKNFGDGVIPAALKDRLLAADPQGFDDIPTAAFDDRYTGTREELDALWQVDENAWAQDVARRVLSWCPTKSNHQLLQLKSLQTQSINRNYLPISAVHIPVSKKADYTLVYSRRDPAIRNICDQFDRAGLTLSQMTDTHTKRLMMAVGTETKPAGGNSQEALAQLAIWSAAGFTKLRDLQESALARRVGEDLLSTTDGDIGEEEEMTKVPTSGEAEVDQHKNTQRKPSPQRHSETAQVSLQPLPPIVGLTAVGHEWATYIACEHFMEDDERVVQVTGPFPRLTAGTRSFYDIFKLLSLVERIRAFIQDVHWPALKKRVSAAISCIGSLFWSTCET
ncbi:MAG: hypothetical protein LQ350_008252 [Teloschistes chrysophthalmus]|nr:MAG: hypothetical protein LQ350_008252 [Niorma chrysophthalma]